MKSPFPGMDPYLEAHWGDIHTSLMVYARNQLNEQLPGDLQARVEESLAVQEDDERTRTVYADVRIVEDPQRTFDSGGVATEALTVATPIPIPLDEERTERHLAIVDVSEGGRLVTAIEILSPSNKVSTVGHFEYWRKQQEYLDAGVNLVEIDLLRAGGFVLAAPQHKLPPAYLICTRRTTCPDIAWVHPVPLRQPLPDIKIPLRPSEEDSAIATLAGRLLSRRPLQSAELSPRSVATSQRRGFAMARRAPSVQGAAVTR